MDLGLSGRTVLITGASRGIGMATAEVFAEEGCDLVLAARDAATLKGLCERLRDRHHVNARAVIVDLRDPEQLRHLVSEAGEVDIAVNNAGDIPGGTIAMIDEERWRHAWELKLFGYINLTRLIYARMKANGRGVIINNIGIAGERMDAAYIAGCAGNAALYALTRALGGVSLADGVRVVGVSPGPVATDRFVALMRTAAEQRLGDADRHGELTAALPAGRAADPREIADLIAFLASDRSAYTSGAIFAVDGGLSACAAMPKA